MHGPTDAHAHPNFQRAALNPQDSMAEQHQALQAFSVTPAADPPQEGYQYTGWRRLHPHSGYHHAGYSRLQVF